jgi:hypothetical protein
MRKLRSDCLAVMITLIIFGWTGMARATAEEDMFTAIWRYFGLYRQ